MLLSDVSIVMALKGHETKAVAVQSEPLADVPTPCEVELGPTTP